MALYRCGIVIFSSLPFRGNVRNTGIDVVTGARQLRHVSAMKNRREMSEKSIGARRNGWGNGAGGLAHAARPAA